MIECFHEKAVMIHMSDGQPIEWCTHCGSFFVPQGIDTQILNLIMRFGVSPQTKSETVNSVPGTRIIPVFHYETGNKR